MSYIKAELILPQEVLELVQKYADGQCLYIPRKKGNMKAWGENTLSRELMKERNKSIFLDYCNGLSTAQLAEKYFLSIKSIQRIVLVERRKKAS
ncbi:CD3324 family protein [Anaerosporobacter faecicola]|uniref:CD3324 family protein n=1 Tax=Anaerosporobacter faecicola TaxID=2718714 RepID=UPI00143B791C|nr:CD3324 family protein [Anaerosporobacter faecicola]